MTTTYTITVTVPTTTADVLESLIVSSCENIAAACAEYGVDPVAVVLTDTHGLTENFTGVNCCEG